MKILYHFGILCYGLAIQLAALVGNSKAKKWIKGRKNWKKTINDFEGEKPSIWIHISSLGEYIMTQPLIELLLNEYKHEVIYLSFFSPSGYENTKIENPRIKKVYLPLDTPSNAKYFVKSINPFIAIFAKYDFWFNYLAEIQKNQIPSIVFSTALNKQHVYFKYSWTWHKNILKRISKILVLKDENLSFLQNEGFDNAAICGDTRFDQVSNTNLSIESFSDIKKFIGGRNSIILGSSWSKEEKIMNAIHNSIESALIIAPHDISEQRISEIENTFKNTIRYSNLHTIDNFNDKVLIIDSIGILATIYEFTDIAIIGGGFSGKLHNILEPASKNNVILFGPNYNKFPEANELIELNAASSFSNENELKNIIDELKNAEKTNTMKNTAFNYIKKNKGASRIVFNAIKELLDHSTTSASSKI